MGIKFSKKTNKKKENELLIANQSSTSATTQPAPRSVTMLSHSSFHCDPRMNEHDSNNNNFEFSCTSSGSNNNNNSSKYSLNSSCSAIEAYLQRNNNSFLGDPNYNKLVFAKFKNNGEDSKSKLPMLNCSICNCDIINEPRLYYTFKGSIECLKCGILTNLALFEKELKMKTKDKNKENSEEHDDDDDDDEEEPPIVM